VKVRDSRAEGGWLFLLAVLLLLPLWRLWSGRSVLLQHDVSVSDLLHSHLPYRAFFGRSIRDGDFPFWMPDVFSGVPYAAQIEAGPFYPPNLIYAVFTPWTAFAWLAVLTTLIAGAGAYGFARRLGCVPAAAIVAGLSYGLAGFEIAHLKHPNMHEAAAWLPWAWWCLHEALRGWRPGWPLVAAVLGLQALAGHPQITYLTLLLLGAHGVVHAWVHRADVRAIAASSLRLGLASACGLGIAAITLVPTWAFNRHSMRAGGTSWEEARRFPLAWGDLLYFAAPSLRGSPYEGTYAPPAHETLPWENYAYVGLLTLLLAAFAVFAERTRPPVQWLAGAAAGALAFALGSHTPLFGLLWRVVPGMGLFRFPVRALCVVDLALALLAAQGADAWLRRLAAEGWGERRTRAVAVLLAALVTVDLWVSHAGQLPMDDRSIWDRPSPLVEAALSDDPHARMYTLDSLTLWARAFASAEGLRNGLEPYRALATVPIANSAMAGGASTADGYTNMLSNRVAAFWLVANRQLLPDDVRAVDVATAGSGHLDARFVHRLRKAAVTHVVSAVPLERPFVRYAEAGPVAGYRLDGAFPPAYVASHWRHVGDLVEACRHLDSADPTPAVEAPGPDDLIPAAGATISAVPLQRPDNDTLVLDVSGREGLLVVAESYDEDWSATVDGRPTPLLVTNGYQRGVLLPRGSSEVVLSYAPAGWLAGAAVSVISAIAAGIWGLWSIIAARPHHPRGTLRADHTMAGTLSSTST
jgi:hypothetical protein